MAGILELIRRCLQHSELLGSLHEATLPRRGAGNRGPPRGTPRPTAGVPLGHGSQCWDPPGPLRGSCQVVGSPDPRTSLTWPHREPGRWKGSRESNIPHVRGSFRSVAPSPPLPVAAAPTAIPQPQPELTGCPSGLAPSLGPPARTPTQDTFCQLTVTASCVYDLLVMVNAK